MIELTHFQVLSGLLFAVGLYGVLARRNLILVLMSIELMLNAVNINLIGYSIFMSASESHRALGHILIIFVITVAAAEVALGLAIIIAIYRTKNSVLVTEASELKK